MSYARELSRRLAAQAEAVCRAYLPAGRRQGRYWIAGDVQGTKGKSLFVKLSGDGAGHFTDGATGEYGDLLDLIRLNKGFNNVREALEEARYFLRDPKPIRNLTVSHARKPERDSLAAAEKLHRYSRPVPGTLAETYLRGRAITAGLYLPALRFHSSCYYRPDDGGPRQSWPALLGVITGVDGNLTGLQRTWLARDGSAKAPCGGYVSWAPLGPRGVVFGVNHPAWVAVGEARFTEPVARVAIVGPRAAGIVRVGQPLPVARPIRGGAFGPPVARISAATGHAVVATPVARAVAAPRVNVAPHPAMRSPGRPGPMVRPQPAPISRPPARRAPARGRGDKR